MISGLDSRGNIYFSLVQSNCNAKIMELFFAALVKKLDNHKPNWRTTHTIMLDNAAYHTSSQAIDFLRKLDVPVIFTGPHSYTAAPIELLFSSLKAVDINPRKLKTGKA